MSLKNPRNTKDLRRTLRKNMTEAESMLWEKVRANKLGIKVKRQYGIGPYVLDFYIPKIRLAIEVDGGIHQQPEVKEKDINRDAFLNRNGIEVIRFTNNQILNEIEKVLLEIKTRVESKTE
ncbi:endonuclease domain-containing protein [Gracilimonas sp.]|uniref:endonuclease domain-containing protein n=1 Tax=Gracilimonas sp. TaxID=1974203 RepID=UPI003BAA7E4A